MPIYLRSLRLIFEQTVGFNLGWRIRPNPCAGTIGFIDVTGWAIATLLSPGQTTYFIFDHLIRYARRPGPACMSLDNVQPLRFRQLDLLGQGSPEDQSRVGPSGPPNCAAPLRRLGWFTRPAGGDPRASGTDLAHLPLPQGLSASGFTPYEREAPRRRSRGADREQQRSATGHSRGRRKGRANL